MILTHWKLKLATWILAAYASAVGVKADSMSIPPYAEANDPAISTLSARGYAIRSCVDYVAEAEINLGVKPSTIDWLGDAEYWPLLVHQHDPNVLVDHNAEVGAVIVWQPYAANNVGDVGHVALLVTHNADNSYTVAEYNFQIANGFDTRVLTSTDLSEGQIMHFLNT